MNDPFGNLEQTQQTITQQNTQQQPIVNQETTPKPITWMDGVGRVTTVGISKSGTAQSGKAWIIYKIGIQDNTGSERTYSTFCNPPPQIGTDINFKAKIEPYFNQTHNKMMDSRQIISFLLTSQGIQQPQVAATQPQGTPQSVVQNAPQSQEIDTFLLKYLESASAPSIYEFIGVFMVKKMSDINLVKQLIDSFNRTVQASK